MGRTIYLPIDGARVGMPRNAAFQPYIQAVIHMVAEVEGRIGIVKRPDGLCFSVRFESPQHANAFIELIATFEDLPEDTVDALLADEAGRPEVARSKEGHCVLFWPGIEIVDRRKSGLDS